MWLIVLVLITFSGLAAADQDSDYLAARSAYQTGDAAKLNRLAARLADSPMEPYLSYYKLRLNLETASDESIRAFLARTDVTPVIDHLRAEWLRLLGKKRRWALFSEEYPRLEKRDSELACYSLQASLAPGLVAGATDNVPETAPLPTQPRQELLEARRIWLSNTDESDEPPDSCEVLFEMALDQGVISEDDIWQRFRLLLEANNVSLAKQLAKKISLLRVISPATLDSASSDPEAYLSRIKLSNAGEPQRLVALFALRRLARQLPQLAFAQWEKNSVHFTKPEHQYFYGWLGYEAARSHDARALDWYRAAGDTVLNIKQLAWRVRAALRAQNWHEVWASIAIMPPEQQRENAWRYWKARALEELGRGEDAEAIYVELSRSPNYYGQLSAEELGAASASAMVSASYQPTKAAINEMLEQPAVQRTLALYRMELRTDAALEWKWATRNFSDKQLLVAAEIARRTGMYDHAINTADRTLQLHDFNLRYPAPYRDVMQGYVRKNELDEAWVFGLMRQESRFVTQAKSAVGAAGVMQVMPATARWIAQKLGMKDYRQSLLHQLDTNLKLGTYYMKTVLSSLDNNPLLASVAYNAGPRRARQWRPDSPIEGAIYADTIPFDETRNYVKNVMSNTVYYAKLFGHPPRALRDRLGIISRGPAEEAADIP